MSSVGMDEECLRSIQESKTLAGIFQGVVDDCKVGEILDLYNLLTKLWGKQLNKHFPYRAFNLLSTISLLKAPNSRTSYDQQVLSFLPSLKVSRRSHIEHQIRKVMNMLSSKDN